MYVYDTTLVNKYITYKVVLLLVADKALAYTAIEDSQVCTWFQKCQQFKSRCKSPIARYGGGGVKSDLFYF